MASVISQERYKRAVDRNIKNLTSSSDAKSYKGKTLEVLKHILGVKASDNSYDSQIKEYLKI
jgi:hypothetical protein